MIIRGTFVVIRVYFSTCNFHVINHVISHIIFVLLINGLHVLVKQDAFVCFLIVGVTLSL